MLAIRRLAPRGARALSGGASPAVFCVGTMDTKADELAYVAARLRALGTKEVRLVDVSTHREAAAHAPDVRMADILAQHPRAPVTPAEVSAMSRADGIATMSAALREYLAAACASGGVAGVLGIGGSGGTSLISAALRELPVGVPKLLVSTVAAGNVAPYVGHSDLAMLPSVVDVAGLNAVSKAVLGNAAGALHGMVKAAEARAAEGAGAARSTVGLTMFGVTTPCVDAVRAKLEADGIEALVFHATGTGGRAMESLVRSGLLGGVLDLTTTEVADELVGGVMAAGPQRLEAAIRAALPLVLSVGAVDMVNFGARDTVPKRFGDRQLYEHNAEVTLMRTSVEENEAIGAFIGSKLCAASAPVAVLLPEKGVSALDAEDMPFHDPRATAALFSSLEGALARAGPNAHVSVERLPLHINDPEFAEAAVRAFARVGGGVEKSARASAPASSQSSRSTAAGRRAAPGPPADLDPSSPRGAILPRLHALVGRGEPIIGAGAGTGISAKAEEAGGADLIVIYNSGRFRMGGRGSLAGLLPFDDANRVVEEMAAEVLPVVRRAPVLAGVCGTDPFRDMPRFLERLRGMGFAGVQNFPTVGLYDGKFRQNLEETGMGFGLEVEMIRQARALGLLTTPYAFDADEAAAMAEAGADVVVAHVGLTTSGTIGASTAMSLEAAAGAIQRMADAARRANPHCLVLCHGGPVALPADARWVLANTRGVHGFYGASSMERLPVETAIAECVREFKAIQLPPDEA